MPTPVHADAVASPTTAEGTAAGDTLATVADIVQLRAADDKLGLMFETGEWTWAEIVQEAADRAALLGSLPEQAGRQRHVGLLLDNVPDYVFWTAACALAGAAVVGINSSRSAVELAQDIPHADVDVIVTEGKWHHLVVDGAHGVSEVWDVDRPEYAARLAPYRGASLPTTRPDPTDLFSLVFSSGSTGAPKAVILTQGRMARLAPTLTGRVELTRESRAYLCMPLFHGNSLMMNLLPAFLTGATVGMVRKFSASGFSADVHRFGATYVNYVGRALSYVLAHPEDPRDRTSALQLAFGTEASEADVARFSERFGCRVLEGYGLSEGVFRLNRTPDTPVGSLGLPAGGLDVRVLDEATGEECPRARFGASGRLENPEAVGQIVAIGLAHTFEGYYKNPKAYAERVRGADFWSGDLAYRDQDGFFYFAGRSSDWLRVDSENFAAAQVERVILRAPGIAAAPVYAVPDPVTGDRVMCALELEAGVSFDPAAFGRFLAAQPDMGGKWWPSFVRVVEAVPLTGSGKVNKAPLRKAAWATTDPVFVRVGKTDRYVAFDQAARDELERAFTEHARVSLLPAEDINAEEKR